MSEWTQIDQYMWRHKDGATITVEGVGVDRYWCVRRPGMPFDEWAFASSRGLQDAMGWYKKHPTRIEAA